MTSTLSAEFSPDAARTLAGPQWLVDRRLGAAEALASTPLPDPSAEEWRYSPIRDLDLDRVAPAAGLGDAPMPRLDIEPAAMVRTINGRVVAVDVDDELRARGVHIGLLAEHTEGQDRLGSLADAASDYFTRLNDAFMSEPVLIHVPRGVVIERPIVVTHHTAGDGTAAFPRLIVAVEDGAHVEVLDHHTSEDQGVALVCPVVELDVAAGGRLGYLNVQELGQTTWQVGSQLAQAGRDASLVAATAAFGGAYARSRADTRMVGRGAHSELLALYFGDGDQTLDFRTYQDHLAPDTTSNLLYKGVVGGAARSIYTGLIRVGPEARGTNAFQTNRNLKLSPDAWAESVPNLEIENNDVRCSHASTVSPIDAEQRFYLESRAVPTDAAERLIVAGFLAEVVDAMPVVAAGHKIRTAVNTKLAGQSDLTP